MPNPAFSNACAPVYLDRSGDALAPAKCLEATTEAQWLRAALEPEALLIRGSAVEKAELFYRGRGRRCVTLQSPALALQSLGLGAQGVAWIREDWGDEFETRFLQLAQPLRAAELLAALFPAAGVPWFAAPTRETAAHWLSWLAESECPTLAPLLRAQAEHWQGQASVEFAPLFAPSRAQEAHNFLSAWLGLEARPRDFPASGGEFPLEIPAIWKERARARWLSDLAGRGAAMWDELRARPFLGTALRAVAAQATATYLCHHPQQINAELLTSLQPHLALETMAQLHDLVPPAAPEPLEIDACADAVTLWFGTHYWPFRQWQSALSENSAHYGESQTIARAAARAFAQWFLRFYSRALASGADAEHMAGRRLAKWRAGAGAQKLTLLVIVDGLHAGDARGLLERLRQNSKRLQLLDENFAFTAIPTITEVAKPALWWGLPPREAAPLTAKLGAFESAGSEAAGTRAFDWPDGFGVGRELKEHADVGVLGAARAGEIWMWNVLKLDSTYHKNYPPATTQTEAATVLDGLVKRIIGACEAVPEHLALRIIISADHGRLPASSARSHPVPAGCAGHGRAALVSEASAASPIAFTQRDFIWESDGGGERVWLNPQRFGLSAPAVVCADENAFEGGGSKTEHFSHGGLWPEEVVVPWIVLARDAATAPVEILVSGRAKAGAVGTLRLEARNGGEMNLIVQEVRARFGPRPQDERVIGVSQAVPALNALVHSLSLERWPDSQSAARCQAIVVLSRPDGSRFEVAAKVELESEELYRASNILDDFD